jgi:hypothetical protein
VNHASNCQRRMMGTNYGFDNFSYDPRLGVYAESFPSFQIEITRAFCLPATAVARADDKLHHSVCNSSSCRSLKLVWPLPASPTRTPLQISFLVFSGAIMRTTTLSVTVPLLLSTLTSALTLDCSHIRVDRKKFNLEKLGGPHSITVVDKFRPPSIHNTTYTVDICHQLDRDADVPKAEQCPRGTYGMINSQSQRSSY